jgi:TPR repeat protein
MPNISLIINSFKTIVLKKFYVKQIEFVLAIGKVSDEILHYSNYYYFRYLNDDLFLNRCTERMRLEGKGIENPNYAEATHLLTTAAENGIYQAEHQLAIMYEYGMGIQPNFGLALKYYRRAAEKNYVESQYNLALMYAYGRGVPQDFRRARSLLDKASLENHAPSVYYIGLFKMYGYGCEPNYEQAVNWLERAANMDDFRVHEKAANAAKLLNDMITLANNRNEEILNKFQKQSARV